MTPAASPQPCPPRIDLCPACGEEHTYICGRSLLARDPAKKEASCLDGTRICGDCLDVFKDFATRAYNAKAVREEWDGS